MIGRTEVYRPDSIDRSPAGDIAVPTETAYLDELSATARGKHQI